MNNEKSEVEEILGRLDELLKILKFLSEDLTEISRNLKTMVRQPIIESQSTISFEEPSFPVSPGPMRAVEDVQKMFPQDLARMLYFEVTEDYMLIKPRQYLGSENFAKIATIVRDQLKGEYVSQGKESHFRVPRKI
ncbi:MAG: hypothetical protein QXH91_01045 [Candidatus Bathyarchaeia archaeon]